MIVPAAVPILAAEVIVDAVFVPASLIVPLFKFIGFVPIASMSPALVAAFAAAIANVNPHSLVPVPDA